MPKPAVKTEKIEVSLSVEQKMKISKLAALQEKSMSQYLLDCGLNFSQDADSDKFTISFLKQQQRTMYIIIQFIMLIASNFKSKEEVMRFYEKAYRDAVAEFGKEDE